MPLNSNLFQGFLTLNYVDCTVGLLSKDGCVHVELESGHLLLLLAPSSGGAIVDVILCDVKVSFSLLLLGMLLALEEADNVEQDSQNDYDDDPSNDGQNGDQEDVGPTVQLWWRHAHRGLWSDTAKVSH